MADDAAFGTYKEKRPIFNYGTAECSTEVILTQGGFGFSIVVVEPIVRVEEVVAKVVVDAAMEEIWPERETRENWPPGDLPYSAE